MIRLLVIVGACVVAGALLLIGYYRTHPYVDATGKRCASVAIGPNGEYICQEP